jgi:hypothetical protein
VVLAGELNVPKGDLANGEDLLDNSCEIAAKGNS